MVSIYPQMRGDFYFRQLNAQEWERQLDIVINQNNGQYLGFKEKEGFVYLSLVGKITQFVKGLLGFTDEGNHERVNAEWLKLLYVGESRGLLTEEKLTCLHGRLYSFQHKTDPTIRQLFQEIVNNRASASLYNLEHMRTILINYHTQHAHQLAPSFWHRAFHKPSLDPHQHVHFGDISLHLAQQALAETPSDPHKAFQFLLEAHHLKNTNPNFQNKLAVQLKSFLDEFPSHPAVCNHESAIQQVWLTLAETAYINNRQADAHSYLSNVLNDQSSEAIKRQAARIYLDYQDYARLEPFLPMLQQVSNEGASFYTKLGKAYWHFHRYQEGVNAYEKALALMPQTRDAQSEKAALHAEIGNAYLDRREGLNPANHVTCAITHLLQAHLLRPANLAYQQQLYRAYMQYWKEAPDSFAVLYAQDWLSILPSWQQFTPLDKQADMRAQIQDVLIKCTEQEFSVHHNSEARVYLRKGLQLFGDQPEYIVRLLDVCLKYKDYTIIETEADKWTQEYSLHPLIQARLGSFYWDRNRGKAIEHYEAAIRAFRHTHARSANLEEKSICETHMAELQAKIGNHQLQIEPGMFTSVPYEEAISRLEEAARLNPSLYAAQLSQAYLAAAANEKQKNFIFRDDNKILLYYAKAFQTFPQNEPYLAELMGVYLDRKRMDEAVSLFQNIQAQPWARHFMLPPERFYALAKALANVAPILSLNCYKKAFQLKPETSSYKRDFYQFTNQMAETQLDKLNAKADSEEKIRSLIILSKMLKARFEAGFERISDLEAIYRGTLAKLYRQLAEIHIRRFLIPAHANEGQHKRNFAADIQNAIAYYDEALKYTPENAELHFDKALVLDFDLRLEKDKDTQENGALDEYRLAVCYNKKNPFYRKALAFTYGVLYDTNKMEEHQDKIKASQSFEADFRLWYKEYFYQVKTQSINAHTYSS
ncbi:hypothetical protein [Candidatus Protochlamydia phocaeensis]|uniref:hypothetical protein n=1 Tax=Candidatus Protochlamydia phocaeensis TaxID=1414722 RepID=UPI000838683F|nr:hypothetical protein [Candidatus Protochlamydia phocaeensis]